MPTTSPPQPLRPRPHPLGRLGRLGLAAWLPLLGACGTDAVVRPNVVFITLDTTRADRLSLYGYEHETDPFLVEFAEDALVFDQAIAPATWTLPSHASMFTGLDPVEHGAHRQVSSEADDELLAMPSVPEELPFFTTRLAEAGYHLIGSVSGRFTARRFGFARGFDEYLEPTTTAQIPGTDLNEFVFAALRRGPTDRPLCLFVNYLDAHAPYTPPDTRDYPFPPDGELEDFHGFPPMAQVADYTPEDLQRASDLYDRELLVQDEALRGLLTELERRGLLDDAIVIITSDHGEAFGEHGLLAHGQPPFEPLVHVPLVVRRTIGGVSQAVGRVAAPVSLSNVAETILANVDLPSLPGNGDRFDLLAMPDTPPPVYVGFRGDTEWVGMLRVGPVKYYRVLESAVLTEGEDYLYDLLSDPGETTVIGLEDIDSAALERLRGSFEELRSSWRPSPSEIDFPDLDASELDALRELGYL